MLGIPSILYVGILYVLFSPPISGKFKHVEGQITQESIGTLWKSKTLAWVSLGWWFPQGLLDRDLKNGKSNSRLYRSEFFHCMEGENPDQAWLDQYRRRQIAIAASAEPPRRQQRPVFIDSSESTWSTEDISTDSSPARLVNRPPQAPASSSSEESQQAQEQPRPRGKQAARELQPRRPEQQLPLRLQPKAKAKAKQRQRPPALDRLALLRRVREQRRAAQAVVREAQRQARVQRVEDRREREQRRRRGLPTRSLD